MTVRHKYVAKFKLPFVTCAWEPRGLSVGGALCIEVDNVPSRGLRTELLMTQLKIDGNIMPSTAATGMMPAIRFISKLSPP